jgi:hypothetical protein
MLAVLPSRLHGLDHLPHPARAYPSAKAAADALVLVYNILIPSIAVKWRVFEHEGFSLALKPGVSLATGD